MPGSPGSLMGVGIQLFESVALSSGIADAMDVLLLPAASGLVACPAASGRLQAIAWSLTPTWGEVSELGSYPRCGRAA